MMNIKYIGMDVHKEATAVAVMSGEGKVVRESIMETKASSILQCIQGVRGDLHVTLCQGRNKSRPQGRSKSRPEQVVEDWGLSGRRASGMEACAV